WQLRGSGAGLRATGSIAIDLGPATVTLGADSPSAAPTVALNLAGTAALALRSTLVGTDLAELLANVARDGRVFTGAGSARGSVVVTLSPTSQALLQDFGVELAGFDVEAEGTITAGAPALPGTLVLPADIPTATAEGQLSLPWRLAGTGNDWLLDSDGNLGTLTAAVDLETLAGHIEVDLALPSAAPRANAVVERGITSGSVVGDLSYDP